MNNFYCFLILIAVFNLLSCENNKVNHKASKTAEKTVSNLAVDHFNIWVQNPEEAKKKLTDIGFTAVPDSLSIIHTGQGTSGRYFYFLNDMRYGGSFSSTLMAQRKSRSTSSLQKMLA